MSYTSQLVPSMVCKAILALQANQTDNAGVVDYERFQDEVAAILEPAADLEIERDDCIAAIKELAAEKEDAIAQRDAVKDLYKTHFTSDFQDWSMF